MAARKCFTITFGDQAENHAGMEMIGTPLTKGFTCEELQAIHDKLSPLFEVEIIKLDLDDKSLNADPASVLVIRNGLDTLFDVSLESFTAELTAIDWDKKAFMYGRVVNKYARWNLCFAETAREPDYEQKLGRIVAFDSIPGLSTIRNAIPAFFGEHLQGIVAEGNYYYDLKKTGIGFHGDAERKVVIALRVGVEGSECPPLLYQWHHNGKAVGPRKEIPLNMGDVYVMSDKAVGHDWKRKNIPTLRHATGAAKYVK
jgi:hypothetical protein